MKYTSTELLEEYYQKIKQDYPHLSEKLIKDISKEPFLFIADRMKSGTLEPIRVKYFGVFRVYKKRAAGMIQVNKTKLKNNEITKQEYDKNMEKLENFFKREGLPVPDREL